MIANVLSTRGIGWKLTAAGIALITIGVLIWPHEVQP